MQSDATLHYLDNAATTRVCPAAAQAVAEALQTVWANPSSLYTPGAHSEQAMNTARAGVAHTLGCTPGELYFTGCGSESNNLALLGAARTRKSWGKRIVCSGFEHPSVRLPLEMLAAEGFEVLFCPPRADGTLDVDELLDKVNRTTILVACMKVNNETGAVVDTERLAAGVKQLNPRTAVHIDAVQAWMRLPMPLDNVDSCSVSGHKIHAPKGIGGLYLRKNYNLLPPYLGGGQEKGMRPGTENLPYILALAAAAQAMQANAAERKANVAALNARLRAGLTAFPDVVINSPVGAVNEVLNFSLNTVRSETMLHFLEQRAVYVSSGSACSKGAASHTLAAMDLPARRIDTALRVSFCGDNTPEDVDVLLDGLADGLRTLAKLR